MTPLGKHILVDLYGCNPFLLDSPSELLNLSLKAIEKSGATVVGTLVKKFVPQGVSGTILISESHFSFHSWPENGALCLDYFTCGEVDPNVAINYLLEEIYPEKVVYHQRNRGENVEGEINCL